MDSTNYILFDPAAIRRLLPFAFTRAVADFRTGIFTVKQKWELYLDKSVEVLTRGYLQPLYGFDEGAGSRNVYINSSVFPDSVLVDAVNELSSGQSLVRDGLILAFCHTDLYRSLDRLYDAARASEERPYSGEAAHIENNWDIFRYNGTQIAMDIEHIGISGGGGTELALSIVNSDAVYIEESARVDSAIINASDGPVYIGKGAHIMDGAILIGPLAVCDNAVVKAGAKIYPDTTIGPWCKVGGEVGSSVLFGYSNKGHDGYLGNSVIGEWCNLGADTNTSNLKNNYSNVKCWSYSAKGLVDSGQQFCGLMMGDHSRSGINTMFNTGTVAGVAANVFGSGFPPKFIPSFSWGGFDRQSVFRIEQVFEMAGRMMERRKVDLTELQKSILEAVFEETRQYRNQPDHK